MATEKPSNESIEALSELREYLRINLLSEQVDDSLLDRVMQIFEDLLSGGGLMDEHSNFLTPVDSDQLKALQEAFQSKSGDLMMTDDTHASAIAVRMLAAFASSLDKPPAGARDRILARLEESFGAPVRKDSPEAIRAPTNMKELVQLIHTSDAKFSDANDDPHNIHPADFVLSSLGQRLLDAGILRKGEADSFELTIEDKLFSPEEQQVIHALLKVAISGQRIEGEAIELYDRRAELILETILKKLTLSEFPIILLESARAQFNEAPMPPEQNEGLDEMRRRFGIDPKDSGGKGPGNGNPVH